MRESERERERKRERKIDRQTDRLHKGKAKRQAVGKKIRKNG